MDADRPGEQLERPGHHWGGGEDVEVTNLKSCACNIYRATGSPTSLPPSGTSGNGRGLREPTRQQGIGYRLDRLRTV